MSEIKKQGLSRRCSAKVVVVSLGVASVTPGIAVAEGAESMIPVSPLFSAPMPSDVIWFLEAVQES